MTTERYGVPTWQASLIALAGTVGAIVVWAYSTFVTIRERDAIKAGYDTRITALEGKYDIIMSGQSEIKGRLDSMLLFIQNQDKGRKSSNF